MSEEKLVWPDNLTGASREIICSPESLGQIQIEDSFDITLTSENTDVTPNHQQPSSVKKENHEMYEVIEKSNQTRLYLTERART